MASTIKDEVNFDKLEKDMQAAMEADYMYQVQNDAKFRAVNQKVATYDEFKEIVAAAHLKPLDKKDKIDSVFMQPWNQQAGLNREGYQGFSTDTKLTVKRLPQNGHEFTRDWRRLGNSHQEKYAFLMKLGAKHIGCMFKKEISFGVLGEIMAVMNAKFKDSDAVDILDILFSLTGANRFSLSVQFLSKAEKEDTTDLLRKCSSAKHDKHSEFIANLRKTYELKDA